MTPFKSGAVKERTRVEDVLRDSTGLPIVDEALAVMTVSEWRAIVRQLLSGLLLCGERRAGRHVARHVLQPSGVLMHGEGCGHTVTNFEEVVINHILTEKGEHVPWQIVEIVHEGGAALLPEIEARLDELDVLIRQAPDRATRQALQDQQTGLLDLRDEKRVCSELV